MEPTANGAGLPWAPELLGPLAGEPAIATHPPQLFAGEENYLSKRQIAKRLELRDQVRPAFARVREEGEQLLYIAPAYQVPSLLHQLGLGLLWVYYYRVALVLTDRRLVEILLGVRGRGLGTRVRSFPWSQVRELKLGLRGLTLSGAKRPKHAWRLAARGDKKLLKRLVPRLRQRLLGASLAAPSGLPLWHCPVCARATPSHPRSCEGCGTMFRSRAMATLLALAFPGAGLLYAGHPVLAALDFVGELILYGLVLLLALQAADAAELIAATGVAVFVLAVTKVESIHLATILVERTKPIPSPATASWRRAAAAGSAVSLLALALPFAFTGRLAPVIDHDLVLAADGWSTHRARSQWAFGDADGKRCEWTGPEGEVVAVMAYTLSALQSFDDFARDFQTGLESPARIIEVSTFSALHAMPTFTDEAGVDFSRVIYLVHDPEGHDVHLVMTDVEPDYAELANSMVHSLLAHASWAPQVPPTE